MQCFPQHSRVVELLVRLLERLERGPPACLRNIDVGQILPRAGPEATGPERLFGGSGRADPPFTRPNAISSISRQDKATCKV